MTRSYAALKARQETSSHKSHYKMHFGTQTDTGQTGLLFMLSSFCTGVLIAALKAKSDYSLCRYQRVMTHTLKSVVRAHLNQKTSVRETATTGLSWILLVGHTTENVKDPVLLKEWILKITQLFFQTTSTINLL